MQHMFIQPDEMLLIVTGCDEDVCFKGPFANANAIINKIEGVEGIQQLLRINCKDKSIEDISEDVAAAYDDGVIGSDRMFEAAISHPFVANSEAFENSASDVDYEMSNDRKYGSYARQHRVTAYDVLPSSSFGRAA
ncbi:hypothetical protein [Bartonella sp. LJL80]